MIRGRYVPLTPDALVDRLAALLACGRGVVRVAVDGPPVAAPEALAERLIDPLRAAGRQAVHVRADGFWRDASLRLEQGRKDPDAYLDWLDAGALRREVLDTAPNGSYLPSLRDPVSNRATRAEPVALADDAIVLVSGRFLLGLGLPFEQSVHLLLTPAALGRRLPDDLRWTLPAYERYAAEVDPPALADVVVRWDDPRHPAASGIA